MKRTRRIFTPELKAQVALEVLTGKKSVAQVCRERNLKDTLVARWRAELMERAVEVFSPAEELVEAQSKIAQLERMVGRLTMELEVAKKASELLTWDSRTNGR
jgi:transposase-like protein